MAGELLLRRQAAEEAPGLTGPFSAPTCRSLNTMTRLRRPFPGVEGAGAVVDLVVGPMHEEPAHPRDVSVEELVGSPVVEDAPRGRLVGGNRVEEVMAVEATARPKVLDARAPGSR
jgi:hypothetical protein